VSMAAHLLGREVDRVRLPGGPWQASESDGRLVQRNDAWFAPRRSGFDSPAGPLFRVGTTNDGLMVQRDDTSLAWRRSGFDSR
jgi:hypothetical protein